MAAATEPQRGLTPLLSFGDLASGAMDGIIANAGGYLVSLVPRLLAAERETGGWQPISPQTGARYARCTVDLCHAMQAMVDTVGPIALRGDSSAARTSVTGCGWPGGRRWSSSWSMWH